MNEPYLISPCKQVGWIPMLKNGSTSISNWLKDAGWLVEEKIYTKIPNFFVMRHPRERLLSSIINTYAWAYKNEYIDLNSIKKMLENNVLIIDGTSRSVVENLYGLDLHHTKLYAFTLGENFHTHTLINLFLEKHNVDLIQNPIGNVNQTSQLSEIVEISKRIMKEKHFYYFLGYHMDKKLYDFINANTKYYRLESNYQSKRIFKKKGMATSFTDIVDTNNWCKFLQNDILPYRKIVDQDYFSVQE